MINHKDKPTLSSTSVASVATGLGTISLSGTNFISSDDYAQWYLPNATNIFGTTEGATLTVTYGF